MSAVQQILDCTPLGDHIDETDFVVKPLDRDSIKKTVSTLEIRYPDPIKVASDFVSFNCGIRPLKREFPNQSIWTVTGLGKAMEDCGNHLGLYSDGVSFTRTRKSCHKQSCPVCSWKWEASAGNESSAFLQFVLRQTQGYIVHASFNPVMKNEKRNGKICAVCGDDGRPLPKAPEGDMRAFGLPILRKFLEKYHDGFTGPLGYVYILHPGRETRDDPEIQRFYFSPHIHLLTNFHFDRRRKLEMEADYLRQGFTFTLFPQRYTKFGDANYALDWKTHRVEKKVEGRTETHEENGLTAKLIYNASHALILKNGRNRRWITYCGAWKPCLFSYEKVKKRVLVRSRYNRPLVKIKEEKSPQVAVYKKEKDGKVHFIIGEEIYPMRDKKGRPIPELTPLRKKKFLTIRKTFYYPKEDENPNVRSNWVKRQKSDPKKPWELFKIRLENLLVEVESYDT